MEHNLIDKDDPYSSVRQDFSQFFHTHNLDNFANASDLGLLEYGKPSFIDRFSTQLEDHTSLLEPEGAQAMRMGGQRDDYDSHHAGHLTSTFSPIGRSHPGTGHYNHGMNANFSFNGMKHPSYQQEYPRYAGYHPQTYYYPNHYDPHMMPSNYDNTVDYLHHPQDVLDNHNDDPLSLMWNDDPAKAMKMKNMSMNGGAYNGEHNNKAKYPSYEPDHDEEKYIRMQELSRLPVRKGLDSQMKMNPLSMDPRSLDVKNPADKGLNASMKFGGRLSSPKRTAGKADPYDDEDDDGGYDGEGKGRSTRGLRVLSLKVREIVSQKKRTSYKEVAETLTYELRQKMTARSQKEESKDEQNVKRRVYDALNVLIAADVLRKEGKIVYCDDSFGGNGFSGKKRGSENREKILADIQEARKRNKAKIEMLHELIFKCLAIKNLIKTNKEKLEGEDKQKNVKNRPANVNATRIDVVQENPALKPKNEDVIRFPFIVLLSSSTENSMNLNMDTLQRQLAIESKKPFNIFGDIDVLLKMGLHYVTRQMFDENIPKELQRYVPKYYLAALK